MTVSDSEGRFWKECAEDLSAQPRGDVALTSWVGDGQGQGTGAFQLLWLEGVAATHRPFPGQTPYY